MFRTEFMPERTGWGFQVLFQEPLMQGFVSIGDTAISIQIGHRLGKYLDFWINEYEVNIAVAIRNATYRLDSSLKRHRRFAEMSV
jgi:hypothetical protein